MLISNPRYYVQSLLGNKLNWDPKLEPRHQRIDAVYEVDILHALLNHPARVDDANQAELFIIAIPFSTLYYDDGPTKKVFNKRKLIDELQQNLMKQPSWMQGKPHVVVAMTSHLFSCLRHMFSQQLGLDQLYERLANVSVARGDDFFATRYAAQHHILPSRGYESHFPVIRTVSQYTFSVGLGAHAKHLPHVTLPSWDKFQKSTNFIFYHTRPTKSNCNSTEYRLAPVHNVSWSELPHSSIGFKIPQPRWIQEIVDSQFCLVIRGDTPHSHSLFAAVKAGCIPVIISDWYLFYSPPFPATLNMWEFCVFLPEEDYIRNPQQSLASLQNISKEVIQDKLKALAWAQQVMILDHPQSAFVPAFLQEAMASFTRPRSELVPSKEDMWCPMTCV
jgi:hypothetical protein